MGRPQVSFAKRQREQAKREKQQLKAERRAQRKTDETAPDDEFEAPVTESTLSPEDLSKITP
jgi:sRNA-binding protein